jgi:hypothetical protein
MRPQFPPGHPLIVARTQVALPEGAFLRALPFTVEETQRFRIDALVLCAAIVASAYEQMVELALRAKWEEAQAGARRSGHLDIAMFQHAWSIVDQLYALRRLIGSLAFKGEDVDAFMAATERAFVLRNRMDHLDQHIPNIVASKDNARSLFGSLISSTARLSASLRWTYSQSLSTPSPFALASRLARFGCPVKCECRLATSS